MKCKNYLLPYSCQLVGWGLLAVCLVIEFSGVLSLEFIMRFREIFHFGIGAIRNVLVCFGMLLVAFSREKHEDEMIRDIRISSVAITGAVAIILEIFMYLTMRYWHDLIYGLEYDLMNSEYAHSLYEFSMMVQASFSVVQCFLLYIVIYKLRLWKNRWDAFRAMKEA